MLRETRKTDPEVAEIVDEELERQEHNIEMIASESTAPLPVMELSGSVFTNKTLEGYPGARFQAGSHVADKLEILANERAKELYGAEAVNIQPYSGSTANYSVYASILQPGDKILSMRLDQGGHLTHGSPANWVSKIYHFEFYSIDRETGLIDYDGMEEKAKEYQPKLIIAGASSYSRLIDYERISKIAKEVGAYFMVDMAHIAGLVAAGLHPSPIPYADVVTTTTHKTLRGPRGGMILANQEAAEKFNFNKAVFPGIQGGPLEHVIAGKAVCFQEALQPEFKAYQTQIVANAQALAKGLTERGVKLVSGGTDNHLMLVDLSEEDVTGKELETRLDEAHITCNKNTIPNDPRSPRVTSGVRLGTPAVTTRGMKEADMDVIAGAIAMVIRDEGYVAQARRMVESLTKKYPLP